LSEIKRILSEKFLTAFLTILLILQFGYDFAYRKGVVDEKIKQIEKKLNGLNIDIQTNSKRINSYEIKMEMEMVKSEIRKNTKMLNNNDINNKLIEILNKYYSSMIKEEKIFKLND